MKRLTLVIAFSFLFTPLAEAARKSSYSGTMPTHTKGYTKKSGTYVTPYLKSSPNKTQ